MWEIVMRGERPSQKIEIQWKALKTGWIHDDAMPCHYLLMKIMFFFCSLISFFFNTISEFFFLVHIMLHIILYIQLFKVNEKNQENTTSSCSNDRKTFSSRPLRLKLTSTTPKKIYKFRIIRMREKREKLYIFRIHSSMLEGHKN